MCAVCAPFFVGQIIVVLGHFIGYFIENCRAILDHRSSLFCKFRGLSSIFRHISDFFKNPGVMLGKSKISHKVCTNKGLAIFFIRHTCLPNLGSSAPPGVHHPLQFTSTIFLFFPNGFGWIFHLENTPYLFKMFTLIYYNSDKKIEFKMLSWAVQNRTLGLQFETNHSRPIRSLLFTDKIHCNLVQPWLL